MTDDQFVMTISFADGSLGSLIYTAGGNSGLAKERFEAHADGKSLTMDDFLKFVPIPVRNGKRSAP
ncbi:MAG: hypothetical protein U0361_02900 [Nitrospiraceae bacterium]